MRSFTVKRSKWPGLLGLLVLAALLFPAYGAEKTTYFHWDAQGSPIAATDETGNVIWREEYRPFGARIKQEPSAASNTRWYTGHPHDDATGLTYMGARYYDPVVGRFMAIDPKGFSEDNPHSFNRYAYANNNPYKYIDPDGEAAETVIDLISLGLSIDEFRRNPSLLNALGVGVDAVGTLIPFVPAGVGIIRATGKGLSKLGDTGNVAKGSTPPASAPVGRRSSLGGEGKQTPQRVNAPQQPVRNAPGKVGEREFSGHALDQMQNRGLTPTVVENAIATGRRFPGKKPGTTRFFDPRNRVTVIVNPSGRVVTVY